MTIAFVNKGSAVGKVVSLIGVTPGNLIVCFLEWQDVDTVPTLSDAQGSIFSYANRVVQSSQRIILAYAFGANQKGSGPVTYTWTSAGGGGYIACVFEMSTTGSFALENINIGGSATSGVVATSNNASSAETSLVAFGAAGFYSAGNFVSGTLDGAAVDQYASGNDTGYLAAGALTMKILSNPGTYNSVITKSGSTGYSWVADLISFKEAGGQIFYQTNYGTLSFGSGILTPRCNKVLQGILSFSGDLSRFIDKKVFGSLSFAGDLTKVKVFLKTVEGVLSFSGSLIAEKIVGFIKGAFIPIFRRRKR